MVILSNIKPLLITFINYYNIIAIYIFSNNYVVILTHIMIRIQSFTLLVVHLSV